MNTFNETAGRGKKGRKMEKMKGGRKGKRD